ncbi:MAG: excinuclease ABC subunit UvrA [Bacteroidia bacterium]|jgi:excinuclease ABC subunit A|nr:excinuclease ABC subunit UvrA [Bacteroidia bacterium]
MKFKTEKKTENIFIKGARVHNLKNIDVTFNRNKLTIVTGVSGSGKSSLVFDTLYAEGQRRYVESLSAYARQFLGKMNKPDVDYIHGISPAIAIEQKVNTRNPRSTVATTTEIYDYLKLLFARIGVTFSPISNKQVLRHTVESVLDDVLALPAQTKVLLAVGIHEKPDQLAAKLDIYLKNGFTRLLANESMIGIEEFQALTEKEKKPLLNKLYLLIDRFVVMPNDEDLKNRMADSIQTAFYEGEGGCTIHVINELGEPSIKLYNNKFELDGITFEEPTVNFFSFNNPYGACKTCEGFGSVIGIDEDLVVPDKSLSLFADAIAPWKGDKMSEWKDHFIRLSAKSKFPIHKPYHELTQQQREYLWRGDANWEGIDGFFKELEKQTYKIQYRVMLARYRGKTVCFDCKGTRLRKDANYVKLMDKTQKQVSDYKNLSEVLLMSIDEASNYFNGLKLNDNHFKIAERILKEITSRLTFLQHVGLGYLSLNRLSNTLSGGESQRINLATSLGSSLVGSLYILDEPSIGLHSRDTEKLINVLQKLRDIGNTVVVVEHDQDIMEVADCLIDIGPHAGIHGGEMVALGTVNEVKDDKQSLTGKYLSGKMEVEVPVKRRKWKDFIEVKGARQHNLKGIDAVFPLHVFTAITGVSGSGKTTLIKSILYPAIQKSLGNYSGEKTGIFDKLEGSVKSIQAIEMVDQNPIGKSSRSNPITYIKAYDPIRDLFANLAISKSRGYKPQHFSFNVDGGRCETCLGEGEVTIEMQFMADIHLPCDECKGQRFKEEILDCKYKDKTISDVLNLSVDEAILFFESETSIKNKIKPLQDVGLGYIKLGQSSNTLSGGEAQRVKLASFLGKGRNQQHTLFIFDEPTTGLHFHDINKLMQSFNALIDAGHSIIVIEHNMDVIKCADWVIDLGPEAGTNGGNLVFAGTPEDLTQVKNSYTGHYLKAKLGNS